MRDQVEERQEGWPDQNIRSPLSSYRQNSQNQQQKIPVNIRLTSLSPTSTTKAKLITCSLFTDNIYSTEYTTTKRWVYNDTFILKTINPSQEVFHFMREKRKHHEINFKIRRYLKFYKHKIFYTHIYLG